MGLGLTHYMPFFVYIGSFVAAFLAMFYRVEMGLFLLVPLTHLEVVWFKLWEYPLGKHLVDMVIIAMLVGWFKRGKEKRRMPGNIAIYLLMAASFAGLFNGSSFFPLSPENPYLKIWKEFILMPILYFITLNNIRDEKNIKIMIGLMALTMFAVDFSFHSSFEWHASEHFSSQDRLSTFVDLGPNEMASFASQGTMLLLGIWLLYNDRWSRIFIASVIVANIYVILYSYSRGAYLAMVAALTFIGLIKERRLIIAVALCGFLWTAILPSAVIERINMTENASGELDRASQVRIDVWKEGFDNVSNNPLGIGFARFRSLGFGNVNGRGYDAHNMVVKMITELGIQGLIVYIWLYVAAFRSGWNLYRVSKNAFLGGLGLGFMACVVANMVCNLFGQDWLLFPVTSYYWVFWALVERARILVRESRESTERMSLAQDGLETLIPKESLP